jgi:hypothetical protein
MRLSTLCGLHRDTEHEPNVAKVFFSNFQVIFSLYQLDASDQIKKSE